MTSTAVIIGAGVTGLSTAYHLACKRFGRIIVLDKGPVGDGSSSRAAAIITGLLWSETGVRGAGNKDLAKPAGYKGPQRDLQIRSLMLDARR